MSVLVQDAAESITSSDVEAVESVRFGDRLGERAQRCRALERAVGPVFVVEGFVLAERVEKVYLVQNQGPGSPHYLDPAARRPAGRWAPGGSSRSRPNIAKPLPHEIRRLPPATTDPCATRVNDRRPGAFTRMCDTGRCYDANRS
jgi:hypothetical protein